MKKKKEKRWSVALALGILLALAAACDEDDKINLYEAEHIKAPEYDFYMIPPQESEVTVCDTGCDDEGIFLRFDKDGFLRQNSVVYAHNDLLLPYRGQYGKRLRLFLNFTTETQRHPLCIPDSSVTCVSLGSAKIEEIN